MSLNRKLIWNGKKYDSWDFDLNYRETLFIFALSDGATAKEVGQRFGVTASRVNTIRREFERQLKVVKPVKKIVWPHSWKTTYRWLTTGEA